MDLVLDAKQKRLHKLYASRELHGWIVNDNWIHNKIYTNLITNEFKEVSYVTKDRYNPLPFHVDIDYVGIVHEYRYDLHRKESFTYDVSPIQIYS